MSLPETQIVSSVVGMVRSTEDLLQNLLWLVIVFLSILLILAIWNLFNGSKSLASGIGNLFLRIKIVNPLQRNSGAVVTHLRSIRTDSATLITSSKLKKGQAIDVDVSSLPNFPDKGVILTAHVSSTAPVRGCQSFLTEIRFKRSERPVIRSLMDYVRQASQPSGSR